MTFEQWITAHPRHACPDGLRYGQWLMNELVPVRPQFYHQLTGTRLDVFYRDDALPEFLEWVATRW